MNTISQVLFLKVEQGNVNKVSEILQQHPNLINFENTKSGQTCLTVACRKNDGPLIEKLIELGADVNKVNKFNQSPLWICAFYNYRRTADFLLNHGADVNLQDKKGCSPLMIAAQRGNLETIAFLLNAKANIQLLNKNQDSVFDLCKDYDTLQFMIQTLQIDEVRVKQPDRFKPKIQSQSLGNTQTKFTNITETTIHKRDLSETIQNTKTNEDQYTIEMIIDSICQELTNLFNESLSQLKDTLYGVQSLIEGKQFILQHSQYIQQIETQENDVQYQYNSFQYEISKQLDRTIYQIFDWLESQNTVTKSPSPKTKKYLSAEPLIEQPFEEEQTTPLSEFKMKKGETNSGQKEQFYKQNRTYNKQFNEVMTQKLQSLNQMINSRIQK